METDLASDENPVLGVTDEPVERSAAPPPVVAVVVTRNPGPWFGEALRALGAADYPQLAVLVVDAGSDEDPTPEVAEILPRAFVRRVTDSVGFAAAANEALSAVEGAPFLLFCHDDAVVDPSAVRVLVEEAYRSNAAVVGPKVVDASDPEILLEVGLSIDRFGSTYTGLEPRELDQAQHDAVRDVFYVSSTALLVRADLFSELGGFDPASFPGSEDLDLCWRARLRGARIVVAPDARVGHHRAALAKPGPERATEPEHRRNRLRTVLKAYSAWSLAWILPLAALVTGVEAVADVLTGRVARARAAVSAWTWNIARLPSLRAARRDVQSRRTTADGELSALQVRGSARLKARLAERWHADDHVRSVSRRGRDVIEGAGAAARTTAGVGALLFLALVVIGSRGLILGSVPDVGGFLHWPSAGRLAATFGSAWRDASLGSAAPASPGFGVMAAISALLLGSAGLAQTAVVVGSVPLGALGTFRLARRFAPSATPALVAGLAYGVNPVARNMIAHGLLGPLVFFALLPFVLSALARSSGLLPGGARPLRPARGVVSVGVWTALAGAFWPPALAVVPVVGLLVLAASPIAGEARRSVRLAVTAFAGAAAAAVLLFPWPLALLGAGRSRAFDLSAPVPLGLGEVLRFHTGPAGAGPAGAVLLLVAVAVLLVGRGARFSWGVRSWALVVGGAAAAWLPGRLSGSAPTPAPEGGLAVAALGAAMAVGLGVGVFEDELRRARFGWRQAAASAAVAALVLPALGFVADAGGGRWRLPGRDWASGLSWMSDDGAAGGFRVLWVGDRRVVPGAASVLPSGAAYSLTRGGTGSAVDLWPGPTGAGDRTVARLLEQAAAGSTSRVGRLLAPMAVRYVAVPTRAGPGSGERRAVPGGLASGLRNQLDLSILATEPGLLLFENDAWIPMTAVATGSAARAVASSAGGPYTALGLDRGSLRPARTGRTVPAGTVLVSRSHDPGWTARQGDRQLRHVRTFGWANGFVAPGAGRVEVDFGGQPLRNLLMVAQALIVVGAVVLWRRARGTTSTATGPYGHHRTAGPGDGPGSRSGDDHDADHEADHDQGDDHDHDHQGAVPDSRSVGDPDASGVAGPEQAPAPAPAHDGTGGSADPVDAAPGDPSPLAPGGRGR